MLFIEIPKTLTHGCTNRIMYRNTEDTGDDTTWHVMYVDVETLHLLITHFGIPTTIFPKTTNVEKEIKVQYCGADIILSCKNNTNVHIPLKRVSAYIGMNGMNWLHKI